MLGLEPGGECEGVAYRVAGELKGPTMAYLRERELITAVYIETLAPIETRDGARHLAYTYVADTSHEQYVAMSDCEAAVAVIASANGLAGPNSEYALNTWANLEGLGVRDAVLESVAAALTRRAE